MQYGLKLISVTGLKYPGIKGGQMPWEAFHYNQMLEVLKEIHWTIRLKGNI
jgi:hypothetical protein